MMSQLSLWISKHSSLHDKFDAYFLSAIACNFSEYPQGLQSKKNFSVLLELEFDIDPSIRVLQKKKLTDWFMRDASSTACTAHLDSDPGNTLYLTCQFSLPLLKKLALATWVKKIQLCDAPVPNRNFNRSQSKPINTSLSGPIPKSNKQKLIAIIDSGCPFANLGFANINNRKTSRFLSIWDQDDRPDFHAADGTKPAGFGYGRQIERQAINRFIEAATSNYTQHIDEDFCYRFAGYDTMQSRETHGSMTLGLLTSHWWSSSLTPEGKPSVLNDLASNTSEVDLVFVQLPRQLLLAPDLGSMERYALDGIRYILDCAGVNTTHIAVVLDYGSDLGPHDGTGLFEQALDALVCEAKTKGKTLDIVFPTGNSFEKALHATADLMENSAPCLLWALPMGNEVTSVAEFWFNNSKVAFDLTVQPPAGEQAVSISLDSAVSKNYGYFSVTVKKIDQQTLVLLQTSPTGLSELANRQSAPTGVWRLDFKPSKTNASIQNLKVDAYTAWGGRNEGFAQRIFAAKFIEIPNGGFKVTGCGSVLSTACGKETYAVGGYVDKPPFARSKYSGAGSVRGGTKEEKGAEYLAPTDEGIYQAGLLCMGARSGTWVRASGTSLAAPQVARALIAGGKLIKYAKKKGPKPDGLKEFGEARLTYP